MIMCKSEARKGWGFEKKNIKKMFEPSKIRQVVLLYIFLDVGWVIAQIAPLVYS